MATFVASLLQGLPLAPHEALSGVFGSVSLASWIFLLVPQVIENYKQGSADGISLAFLIVWFIGDITNLIGALWAGLVPTVIALAVYFCFADLILIAQVLYYNLVNSRKTARKAARGSSSNAVSTTTTATTAQEHTLNEEAPLLARRESSNLGLPGSHRRSSAASRRRRASSLPSLGMVKEDDAHSEWIKNALSIIGVIIVGATGWVIAWKTGVWEPTPAPEQDPSRHGSVPWGATVSGYVSAVCYLGARIPQIIKNQKERSCEGLSLLFFMLSLLGNATYGAGILFHSLEKEYFLTNLPWLIGSLGTIVEDAVIFIQFRVFGNEDSMSAVA